MTKDDLLAEVLNHEHGYLPPTKQAKKYESLEEQNYLSVSPRGYLLTEKGIKNLETGITASLTYTQLRALRKLLEPSTENEDYLYDHLPESIGDRTRRKLTKKLIKELAYIEYGNFEEPDEKDNLICALVTGKVNVKNPNLLNDKELLIECVKAEIDLTNYI